MAVLGNILWFLFGGGLIAWLHWCLLGILFCMTIVGIPFGMAAFRIAGFAAFPFGKELVDVELAGGKKIAGTIILNIIWIIIAGLWLALSHFMAGILCFFSIIGIFFGFAHFKLAGVCFSPLGKRVVSKGEARLLKNGLANEQLLNQIRENKGITGKRLVFLILAAFLTLGVIAAGGTIVTQKYILSDKWIHFYGQVKIKKPLSQIGTDKFETWNVEKKSVIQDLEHSQAIGLELKDTRPNNDTSFDACRLAVTYFSAEKSIGIPPEFSDGRYFINSNKYNRLYALAYKLLEVPVTFTDHHGRRTKKNIRFKYSIDGWIHGGQCKALCHSFYFYNCNREYLVSSESLGGKMSKNDFGGCTYLAKIEWSFYEQIESKPINEDKSLEQLFLKHSKTSTSPSKKEIKEAQTANSQFFSDEAIEASKRIILEIVPILEADHWPDKPSDSH